MASLDDRPISRSKPDPDPDTPDRAERESAQPGWLLAADQRETALSQYLPERWRRARVDPGHKGLLALGGVGIVVVLISGYGWIRDSPAVAPVPALPVVQPVSGEQAATSTRSATPPVATTAEPAADVVVSVVGLVVSSGLVHLPPGSRVADALAAAGGARDGADVLALNLAAPVADGDQITVGAVPPEGRAIVSGTVSGSGASPSAGSGGVVTSPPSGSGGPVNLNSATVAELDSLSGVGPVTAANIVSWREVNGPFTDVGQLAEVDGIGPVRLEKLRDQVTV